MSRGMVLLVALSAVGCAETVTVTVTGNGSVADSTGAFECSDKCVLETSEGEVILGAKAGEGQSFIEWTGDCKGQKALCTLTVDGPKTATVRFAPLRKLSVTVKGEGKVATADRKLNCPGTCDIKLGDLSKVDLIATATGKDVFAGFSGDCEGKRCDLMMNKDKAVVASFEKPPGTVLFSDLAGPMDDKPKVAIAGHESGGFVVATAHDDAVSLRRFDKDGNTLFYELHKLGETKVAPGLAFFGDDVVVVVGGKKSSTIARITPDGKTARFTEKLQGCPGFTQATVVGASVFVAGTFGGQHDCGEASLLASGKNDIAVARVSLDDGKLTWAAQTGAKGKVDLRSLVVTKVEDTYVAFNSKKGARVVKFNPAGKAFPVIKVGKPQRDVKVRHLAVDGTSLVLNAIITAAVDFGGGKLGVAGQNGPRLVSVKLDDEGRHQASKLVGRARCGDTTLCTFDREGGFLRVPIKPEGKFEKKAKDVDISTPVSRTGPDGTDKWSVRVKGAGAFQAAAGLFHQGRTILLVAARGELDIENAKLSGKTNQVHVVVLRD